MHQGLQSLNPALPPCGPVFGLSLVCHSWRGVNSKLVNFLAEGCQNLFIFYLLSLKMQRIVINCSYSVVLFFAVNGWDRRPRTES